MTTGPKTVVLANAGIEVLLAPRDGSRNLDPRARTTVRHLALR
jgi:hypothetical protein